MPSTAAKATTLSPVEHNTFSVRHERVYCQSAQCTICIKQTDAGGKLSAATAGAVADHILQQILWHRRLTRAAELSHRQPQAEQNQGTH